MGWLICGGILLFFVLLFSLSLAIDVCLGGETRVSAGILGWRYPIVPAPPKKEKTEKQKATEARKKAKKETKKAAKKEEESGGKSKEKGDIKGTVEMVLDLCKAALPPLGYLLGSFRLVKLEVEITVGGEDAAQIAQDFGKLNAVFYTSYHLLQQMMKVKVRRIDLSCDFLLPETRQWVSFQLKIRLGVILLALLRMAGRYLVNTVKKSMSGSQGAPAKERGGPGDRQIRQEKQTASK